MSVRASKPSITDIRRRGTVVIPNPTVLPLVIPPLSVPKKRFKLSLHPLSLGILGGLVAVLALGLFIPRLSAKVVSPVDQKTPQAAKIQTAVPISKTQVVAAKSSDHVVINRLGTNAPVIAVGIDARGNMDTPKTLWQVGLYDKGAVVGANGTAVIVGHAGAPGQVGVFEHLDSMRAGDIITYIRSDGTKISFKAMSSKAYPLNTATAQTLVASTAIPSLNLISCYGHWDQKTQEYDQRWIVKAILVN